MSDVRTLRTLSKARRTLDRTGITSLPGIRAFLLFIKKRLLYHRVGGVDARSATIGGLKLIFPEKFTFHYVLNDYEPLTQGIFSQKLKLGMTVADVGAHIGYFSLLAAKLVGNRGIVYAVEPCEENLTFLRENIRRNGNSNIRVHPVAAGRKSELRMFQITGSSDSHGFYPHPNTATVRTVEVQQRPMDDILKGQVDLIKIDVEGAEIEVLDGLQYTLAANPSLSLLLEWFPAGMKNAGRDPAELPERLQQIGFRDVQVIDEHAGKIRSVNEVTAELGVLPTEWYANLWARRNSA